MKMEMVAKEALNLSRTALGKAILMNKTFLPEVPTGYMHDNTSQLPASRTFLESTDFGIVPTVKWIGLLLLVTLMAVCIRRFLQLSEPAIFGCLMVFNCLLLIVPFLMIGFSTFLFRIKLDWFWEMVFVMIYAGMLYVLAALLFRYSCTKDNDDWEDLECDVYSDDGDDGRDHRQSGDALADDVADEKKIWITSML